MSMSAPNTLDVTLLEEMLRKCDLSKPMYFNGMRVITSPLAPPGQVYLVDEKALNPLLDMRYTVKKEIDEAYSISPAMQAKLAARMQAFDETKLFEAMKGVGVYDEATKDVLARPPPHACDACRGTGSFNGEECWHCHGEGDDPTK